MRITNTRQVEELSDYIEEHNAKLKAEFNDKELYFDESIPIFHAMKQLNYSLRDYCKGGLFEGNFEEVHELLSQNYKYMDAAAELISQKKYGRLKKTQREAVKEWGKHVEKILDECYGYL